VKARVLLGTMVLAAGCGSSNVSTPPTTTPTPPPGPAVAVITATGIRVQVIHVWEGRRVTFENQDTQPHAVYSDQHPTHGECAGKMNLGVMQPSERREITDLPFDACYFHDDLQPGSRAFTGVVVVH
jgi:hypothetical protein